MLLPKNNDMKRPKNYRPIACLKIIYKIYTSILNQFLVDHCTTNNIITTEKAECKKQSWGCFDQLLINEMILEKVQHQRKNLLMMWLDYNKAFDSVPHYWIIRVLLNQPTTYPPTTNHLPTNPPTTDPPTHWPNNHRPNKNFIFKRLENIRTFILQNVNTAGKIENYTSVHYLFE